jgi:hypothetical protein
MEIDYINLALIMIACLLIGSLIGVEFERERMRADYTYILRMRQREQEEKDSCHKPTG